jgi:uncharacterized protein (TIGR03435 family)
MNRHTGGTLTSWRRLRLTTVAAVAISGALVVDGLCALRLRAQSPAANSGTPAFEVASVRPNKSSEARGIRLQPGGRFTAVGIPLRDLIRIAYGLQTLLLPGQIVGGPDWLGSDRFDIVAKAEQDFGPPPPEGGPPNELLAMLRTLLEDRFKVKVHTETRELPIYALVMARSDRKMGPQLRSSAGDCVRPGSVPARDNAPPPRAPDASRFCGNIRNNLTGVISGTGITMEQWATTLATFPIVSRVVRNRTGLTGEFDLHMEFVPAFLQNPNPDGGPVPNPEATSGANLFTALQEQLGLKLDSQKGPVDVLVIDRAEKPSED